ncbi:MAG TPA: DUF58 domain-containing protein [Tepidisphaeraceae bacterium]|nr:DUF58 domain-containing protein [Tepidisphaeraceae bacterium]
MNFLRQPVFRLGQSRVPQSSLPGATVVRFRPGLDFSGTGLMYCCMMVFMGVAALNSQANLLFGVFGLMIGVLLVSGIISRAVLRRLRVRRELPPHGVVGQPMRITYEITNTKRHWPSLSVTMIELDGVQGFVAQPQCYLLHAAPKMTARIPVEITAKRRGLYEFDRYQLATSFPFGFIKRAVPGRQKDLIEIYPALAKVDRRLLMLCRSADTSGAPMRPRPGGADEFYGVKEHRPGDNPRWIYWRRSAHTNKLVSKQMTEVAPPRLLLLVDTSLPEQAKIRPPATAQILIERTIAMAASLAAAALDDGLSVGLCAYTGPGEAGWKAIQPTRGKNQRADLLSLLARLPASTPQPTSALLESCHSLLKTGTTAVLLTPHDLQVGLLERARGGIVVISAMQASAQSWFSFEPPIEFALTAPMADLSGGNQSLVAGVLDHPGAPRVSATPATKRPDPAIAEAGA